MRLSVAGFAAVAAVHLGTQLAHPDGGLADLTQVLLMPLLAWVLLDVAPRPLGRLVALTLVALFFSWIGDSLPRVLDGDAAFLAMVGGFLIAQLVYAYAFWPWRARSLLARPPALIAVALVTAALALLLTTGAGALRIPVLIYAFALVTMALAAGGLGRLGAWGGAVFLVSDGLIAVDAFTDVELPVHGFWVMATYLAAQSLLVAAVVRVRQRERVAA